MELKTKNINKYEIISEVLEGLSKDQMELSCKYFYDAKGSALFDEICKLEEYYPTRTELQIMNDNIEEISSALGENILLVELGSGSSIKTRLLLEHLSNLTAYIPIDISSEHLLRTAESLRNDFPKINIYPLDADYNKPFELPKITEDFSRIVVYYPGSTVGNFTPKRAKNFINRTAKILGINGTLLVGVDLKKDKKILEAAYNDSKGITAEFNINILERFNSEIGSNFDVNKFTHHAFYNENAGRIEMHLKCTEKQDVRIDGITIIFDRGDDILTEYSYKYTLKEFEDLVSDNFLVKQVWVDENNLFSVQYLEVKEQPNRN